MRLWDFALKVHARPGVEAVYLRLQDDHRQCVSFLLWRLWTVVEERAVDARLLGDAALTAKGWEAAATLPLRGVRRRLKTPVTAIDAAGQAALREAIKAAELQSERLLLEALETLTPAPSGAVQDLDRGLMAAALAWGGTPAPPALLRVLADAAG